MLPQRRRRLRVLYAHLYGQLDQKIGREKDILKRYIHALGHLLREKSVPGKSEDRHHARPPFHP